MNRLNLGFYIRTFETRKHSDQYLQHALGRFAAKCEAAGMRISTSKSEAMVLSRKRVAYTLQVGGKIFPQEEFKYLRVLFMSEGRMERKIDRRIGPRRSFHQPEDWQTDRSSFCSNAPATRPRISGRWMDGSINIQTCLARKKKPLAEVQTCCITHVNEPHWFLHVKRTCLNFYLPQLLWVDEYLFADKSLNSIWS